MSMEIYSYLYNKNIFKEAGIDADAIKTQSDLTEAVKKIDEQKDTLGLDAVFAFPAKETWSTGMHGGGILLHQNLIMTQPPLFPHQISILNMLTK